MAFSYGEMAMQPWYRKAVTMLIPMALESQYSAEKWRNILAVKWLLSVCEAYTANQLRLIPTTIIMAFSLMSIMIVNKYVMANNGSDIFLKYNDCVSIPWKWRIMQYLTILIMKRSTSNVSRQWRQWLNSQ